MVGILAKKSGYQSSKIAKEKFMKWMSLKMLAVLVIVSMLLGSCSSPIPAVPVVLVTPSATPAPGVKPAATATSAAPQNDDVWNRIVANKKIVVGASWDYPPFASVDSNFQVVGFDMALIQEIGRRLKIPIDIQNYAFDGLSDALQLNQVDLAIAAISVTPERAGQMSFSPVYYVNETAVLARNDSQVVSITDISQLAGLRVGVQRGTTYEDMAKNLLVNTGLIHADQLLSYAKADESVQDLVSKRVDLVVTGLATASYYSSKLGLKVVGKGFNQQNLAVAMRLGTPRLKAEIDRVMGDMLTDGTILALIQQYLQNDVAGVLPSPTPLSLPIATLAPPAATLVPPVCVNGMKFVSDITLPDNNMKTPPYIKSGTGFVKTWRVQNTGTCTWTTHYRLVYAYGNVAAAQMTGQPLNLPGNVLPGQSVDLSVTLIAPTQLQSYQGFWQLENANGGTFGQTIWVGITTISDSATPNATLLPPLANYCQVTLTGPKAPVVVHSSFDAVWTVTNTSGSNWNIDSVDYRFISGTAMHEHALYDFTETIKDGESGKIIVDMIAPPTVGIYNTQWAIVSGSKTLCILNVSVTVIAK
jgi:ABC-type amino acid transport substrate-binding protein